jgi:lysophospholipase L1-like esterase
VSVDGGDSRNDSGEERFDTARPDDEHPASLRRGYYLAIRIGLLLVTVFLVLVGAEIYVQSRYSFMPRIQIGTGEMRLGDDLVQAVFEAGPETIWRFKRNIALRDDHSVFPGIVANGQRLRQEGRIPDEKAANEFRILFIGDSITFGWGVRHDETFAKLTEQELRERFPDVETTCINAGVPAYSLFQGWRFLETEGFDYQPDLVVAGFGPNDQMSWGPLGDFDQYEHWQAQLPAVPLRGSMLAQVIVRTLWRPPPDPGTPDRPRLLISEFNDLWARVRDASRARGAGLIVMVESHIKNVDGRFPADLLGPYQFEVARFGKSLRLGWSTTPALVDSTAVLQELAREYDPSEIFLDEIHPTRIGHAALAEALVAIIAPWLEAQISLGRFASTNDAPTAIASGAAMGRGREPVEP